jgi:hypothetical protein
MTKFIFHIYPLLNKAKRCLSLLFVFAIILTTNILSAQTEPLVTGMLSNAAIKTNAVLTVSDAKFIKQKSSILATKLVNNTIIFEINEASTARLPNKFTYRLDLVIDSKDINNQKLTSIKQTVVLDYDATSSRTALRQVINLQARHELKITVVKTTYTSSDFANISFINNTSPMIVPPKFNLYAAIAIERVMLFPCTNKIKLLTPTDSILDIKIQKVERKKLAWQEMQNANEYDVEWTFYDDKSQLLSSGISYPDFDFIFKNNATRITTTKLMYPITLVYPAGRIFYRIRGVHYAANGQREVTAWTSDGLSARRISAFPNQFTVTGHDTNWNWQTQQVFAEEGKQTQSLKYFDASLRERQTQALSNATQTVVVGETIYDAQGRPVVKVMPAPMPTPSLGYIEGLSKSKTPKIGKSSQSLVPTDFNDYSRLDFINGINDCTAVTEGMKTNVSKGAANYFSPDNPLSTNAENQYTPNAEEHPFSVTEFMPDATGRIRRQSGVGKDFKLGSGHETRYFYAKPSQEELDRLFGIDVGSDTTYLKNMVIDGNGQASVSYIDAHGRTIATALAGETTENLDKLTSLPAAPDMMTKDLLNNFVQGESLVSSYTLPIHTEGVHTINYLINKSNLKVDNLCPSIPTCLTVSYFDNISLSGNPIMVRNETSINNDWGSGPTNVPGLAENLFSIRYESNIVAPVSGTYTFTATADDGIRLWINGVLVIDKWILQGPTAYSATYNFVANNSYAYIPHPSVVFSIIRQFRGF